MKSVLISIRPKWVEKIASGKKTIEVRKSRPKIETPFKCYIYCTKESKKRYLDHRFNTAIRVISHHSEMGKVIGEFVCDKIEEFHEYELSPSKKFYEFEKARLDLFLKESCLSYNEVCDYRKNLPYYKPLYGWHISDLKIYDKPKELSEFKTGCKGCKERDTYHCKFYCYGERPITRPPQSWQYVEEL